MTSDAPARPGTDPLAAPSVAAELLPVTTFDAACAQVVAYLERTVPMGLWAVTRVAHGQQVLLAAADHAYGVGPGTTIPFDQTPCSVMVAGEGPRIAPDVAAVAAYARTGVASTVQLGAYVGTPIVRADGRLFGTVCGFDPGTKPDSLREHTPLLELLSGLLSAVYSADAATTAVARQLEQVRLESESDALTGLLNRRGWDRFLAQEEERFRRFGDPACVVVLDLDRLKVVNDTLGHEAGDRYIRAAADALRDVVRDGDVLARLGGDEFGVVAVGASAEMAEEMVRRMSDSLAAAGVAGSFGHAPYSVVAGFPGAWHEADAAMYAAKRQRREG